MVKYILKTQLDKFNAMKKILILSTSLMMTSIIYSQKFSASVDFGMPTGKIAKHTSSNIGLGLAYTKSISDKFSLGLTTGYSHYFVKSSGKDIGTVPLALKVQSFFSGNKVYADLDLGYSFSINNSFEGGLYTYPKVGYILNKNGKLYVGYKNTMSSYKHNIIGNSAIKSGAIGLGSINFGIDWSF
ncbi:hypothetical protein D1Z98_07400 [Riemerella anatipestifer]|nr:hypothetical protein [Riemerella anatipestifer]MRM94801.1 hypothetical protein [Riemerella anatipestifer]MRQ22950.1 hypothetical protein [Riemerella anatipestifer]UZF08301.1 hypothetical protein D9O39_07655 [Riemerella anatipestifer]